MKKPEKKKKTPATKATPPTLRATLAETAAAAPPVLAGSGATRKIDLACGQTPREGFEGLDIYPGAAIVHNLGEYPWPIEDNSCIELHCSHFVEHIPMEYVDASGKVVPFGTPGAQDAFFRFFDECWRIMAPGSWLTVLTPCARNNRAFQDPTHRRFIVGETFLYMSKAWREQNKLDHYNVKCNFDFDVNPSIPLEYNAFSPEVITRRLNSEWNFMIDWQAKLKAVK